MPSRCWTVVWAVWQGVILCVSDAKQVLKWCVGSMTGCYIVCVRCKAGAELVCGPYDRVLYCVCQMQSRCWTGVWAVWQGVILCVSDAKQVLKWCLGSTAVGAQYGAVSALSFNRDCSRLLCGFAKGQVRLLTAFTCRLEPGAGDHVSEIKKYLGIRIRTEPWWQNVWQQAVFTCSLFLQLFQMWTHVNCFEMWTRWRLFSYMTKCQKVRKSWVKILTVNKIWSN